MDVLFAVLPFIDLNLPAIGVSLLKAQVERAGFTAQISYFSHDLAETIGLDLYRALAAPSAFDTVATAAPTETLLGEWFFAEEVFGGQLPATEEYVSRFLAPNLHLRPMVPDILAARAEVGRFVDACAETIRQQQPRIVGFSSVFCQTCANLAVAKRLKEGADAPIVVFGGSNCAAEMGRQMIRSFPWIDYVCTGEGDDALPALLDRLIGGKTGHQVPGFLEQGTDRELTPAPLVRDLDALPFPDYSSFFERHRESPLRARLEPRLSLETSRGCWWGAKHHCTFCGLNAEGMAYRAKSPDRVLDEIAHLCETYPTTSIDCVDTILHMKYFDTVLPRLAERSEKVSLFYETKANLTLQQVRRLREAGVWRIQPGIESFSDEALRLMKKGCTALDARTKRPNDF